MANEDRPFDDALIAEFLDDYFAECEEHLASIRACLLALERSIGQPGLDTGVLDSLLRAFHSIKGLSGMVGLLPAETLAHAVEGRLRQLRDGRVPLAAPLYDDLTAATALIEQVLAARRTGQNVPDVEPMAGRLAEAPVEPAPPREATVTSGLDAGAARALAAALQAGATAWRFVFISAPERAARGINVNAVRSRLQGIGELIQATPRVLDDGRVAFEFLVASNADPAAFAAWSSDGITFEPYAPAPPPAAMPGNVQAQAPDMPASVAPANYVRVDLQRLDDLVRQVGDLVVSRARLADRLGRLEERVPASDWRQVEEAGLVLDRQLRNLRESAMRVRLVSIGEVFARMQFAIREVARNESKQVTLSLSGQETEIDKLVIERMIDPLLHLVRNAVSHGIESPEDRQAAGKPAAGHIALRAATAGDTVIIEVEDDGRGIDRERVARRGRELGLVRGDETLDDPRLVEILCAPGFSTRQHASLASGRGMGLAVVGTAVRDLRGTFELTTKSGAGTCFTIRLPLTLAIIDALVVSVGDQAFAVPQLALREVIEVDPAAIIGMERGELISYRGSALPLLRLARLFNLEDQTGRAPRQAPGQALYALVVGAGPQAVGLVVDRLRGQREVVVSAITDPLAQVRGIAGATDLGDGRAVLILDPAVLGRRGGGANDGRQATD